MRDIVIFRATPSGERKVYNPDEKQYVKMYQPKNYALGKEWLIFYEKPLSGEVSNRFFPDAFIKSLYDRAVEAQKEGKEYFTFTKEEWRTWEDYEITEDTVIQYGRFYFKPGLFRKVKMKIDRNQPDHNFDEDGSHHLAFVLLDSYSAPFVKLQPWYIFGGPKDNEYWVQRIEIEINEKLENILHFRKVYELLNQHYKVDPMHTWIIIRDKYPNLPDLARNHNVQQFFIDHGLADEGYINFMIKLQNMFSPVEPVETGIPDHPLFEMFPGRAATDEEILALKIQNTELWI